MTLVSQGPYPGPRAFEAEEREIFFGRDREVQEIFSLLVAHRAVLLYAQSGAGKTSLLRAALVPLLEQEGFVVLPIGRVQGVKAADFEASGAPNVYVYNVLSAWAGEGEKTQGIPAGLAALPIAVDARGEARPRIVIFDQFEELFTAYPQYWQQRKEFIRQLAAAAHADALLRLLFVIREDYLANLDPYADLLPEQLAARFRIERLSAAAAQHAVEGPLRDTDRKYAPGVAQMLVDQLLTTAVEDAAGSRTEVREQYAEPVQLQVVCRSLWERLPADVKVITPEHLEAFGDVDQALTEFYEKALADTVTSTRVPQRALREFFNRHLITPAGTRGVVFQEKNLTGGIPNAAIRLLEDQHHIVRADTRLGARWYELTHDRLVEPIRRSNEQWLHAESGRRVRRRLQLGAATLLSLMAIAFFSVWQYQEARTDRTLQQALEKIRAQELARQAELEREREMLQLREAERQARERMQAAQMRTAQQAALQRERADAQHRALTVERIETLRRAGSGLPKATREAIIDSVANYLWSRGDDREIEKILSGAAALYPSTYGIDEYALNTQLVVPPAAAWPLELHYNPLSRVDTAVIAYHWQGMAQTIAHEWGVPVPSRLKMVEDAALAVYEFRLVSVPAESKVEGAPRKASFVVRSEPGLVTVADPGPAPQFKRLREFLMRHHAGKVGLSAAKVRKTYYWAPVWTQPVWKVAGHNSVKREGLISLAAAALLLEQPELMVTAEAVGQILKRVAELRPKTVEEAITARKGATGLAADFVEIVRRDVGLVHADFLLDLLANYPGLSSQRAAELAVASQNRLVPEFPAMLSGARPSGAVGPALRSVGPHQFAYQEVTNWLPGIEPPVRVFLGSALLERFTRGRDLAPDLREALAALRGKLARKFGFNPPSVRFYPERELAPHAYRIEILNQGRYHEEAGPVETAPSNALAMLVKELELRYTAARTWWLDTDAIARILDVEVTANLRGWLLQRYSPTDLKMLLQSQIVPGPSEISAYDALQEGLAYRLIRDEQTIRDTSWLLGSLVFYAQTGADTRQRADLVGWLRRVQSARSGTSVTRPSRAVDDLVSKGIQFLVAKDLDMASEAFRAAVAADRTAATTAFVAGYVSVGNPGAGMAQHAKDCTLPRAGRAMRAVAPALAVRYEIEALLERSAAALAPEQRRFLQLCLMWSHVYLDHPNQAHALLETLDPREAMSGWPAHEQYVLAAFLLRLHRDSMAEPRQLDVIWRLLTSSIPRLPLSDAEAVFDEILKRYERSPIWHLSLLTALSQSRDDSFWIPYQLGHRYAFGSSAEDGDAAIELLALAHQRNATPDATERARRGAWVRLAEGSAWSRKVEYGGTREAYLKAEQVLASIETLEQKDWPSIDLVYSSRIDNHYYADLPEDVERLSREWVTRRPESSTARRRLVMMHMGKLDMAAALGESLGNLVRLGGEDADSLFEIAMITLVAGTSGYEGNARRVLTKTRHEYRDYIRLMLYWRLQREGRAGHARALIEERWKEIERATWRERVNQGDIEVWREMLIGYFYGAVSWDELSAPLADVESFARSPLSLLGMTLRSIRAEAHFYNALLQDGTGHPASRSERYRTALELASRDRHPQVYEYHMARYLLAK